MAVDVQTFDNPENWNVVQLSAVDDMLRRVNITLNNMPGERVSVNDLTVTGCYDSEGRPVYISLGAFFFPLVLDWTKHYEFMSLS